MKIGIAFREKLAHIDAVALDSIISAIVGAWAVEHNGDDTHGSVHADRVASVAGYAERGRTPLMGEWADEPFAATNFTSSGASTWTLTSPDQIQLRYMIVGKSMTIRFRFDTTTVSGGQAQLRFKIPAGKIAAMTDFQGGLIYTDNGAASVQSGTMFSVANANFIAMQPGSLGVGVWTASVNNTFVRGVFGPFEIQ